MGKYTHEESDSRKKWLILCFIALSILIILILLLLLRGCGDHSGVHPFVPDLDDNAQQWQQTQPPHQGDPDAAGIKIPAYPSIPIKANTQNVQMALLNPEGNPCYFIFSVILKDTEELLYQSKMVAPGQVIVNVTLNRPLEPGEYRAVVKIATASLTDGKPMNGANVETVLVVK